MENLAMEMAAELPVFDLETTLDRVMGDHTLVGLIVDAFLSDMPGQIALLQAFVAAKDMAGARKQAHQIRGAVSNVGGAAMSALAFEVEKAAARGDSETVLARTPELIREFSNLRDAISRQMKD